MATSGGWEKSLDRLDSEYLTEIMRSINKYVIVNWREKEKRNFGLECSTRSAFIFI